MNKNAIFAVVVAVAIVAGVGLWFQAKQGGAVGGVVPNPPAVNFGSIFVGVTARGAAQWTNNTNKPVTVSGYGTSDTPPFGAPRTNFNQVVVQPGQDSPAYTFYFTPTTMGPATGEGKLVILPPGPASGKVALSGEGVYNLASGALSISFPAPLSGEFVNFGPVVLGQTKTVTISVNNSSDAALTVQGAWAFGNRGFLRTNPTAAFAVANKGQTAVTLSFTPKAAGMSQDVIIFVYPQAPLNSTGVYVRGEGVQG